jgi:hypothetical protein
VQSPDFSQLPDWARWLAQDADGVWWAYEHEPNLADTAWYENEVGRGIELGRSAISADWQMSLKKI